MNAGEGFLPGALVCCDCNELAAPCKVQMNTSGCRPRLRAIGMQRVVRYTVHPA